MRAADHGSGGERQSPKAPRSGCPRPGNARELRQLVTGHILDSIPETVTLRGLALLVRYPEDGDVIKGRRATWAVESTAALLR